MTRPDPSSSLVVEAKPAPLLSITDLSVSFDMGSGPRVEAVNGLDLSIHPQQTLAVVGESGCGKSVTALSVMGLLPQPPGRVDAGRIELNGRNLLTLAEKEMLSVRGGEIAMIFQEPVTSLNPVYTVGHQIIEAIRLHQPVSRREAAEVATQALRDVGIARPEQNLKAYPHELSGGMCQRAMTAMALACQPKLLLADEPTTALDVTIQAQILDLLNDLQHRIGMSIMLITHDLGVVAQVADVVCVMYAGRVLEYASVFDLFDEPLHPYTRGLFSCIPRLDERKRRLLNVSELIADAREFRKLPGYANGLVPWWPTMPPPQELARGADSGEDVADHYRLFEVEPGHWVGCWRTEYVADHPLTRPDLAHRRQRAAE